MLVFGNWFVFGLSLRLFVFILRVFLRLSVLTASCELGALWWRRRELRAHMSLAPSSHLNDGNVYAETVPAAASGQLLLDFLSCRYTHSSREAWSAHGKAGRICLDAVPVSPDTVLRA